MPITLEKKHALGVMSPVIPSFTIYALHPYLLVCKFCRISNVAAVWPCVRGPAKIILWVLGGWKNSLVRNAYGARRASSGHLAGETRSKNINTLHGPEAARIPAPLMIELRDIVVGTAQAEELRRKFGSMNSFT